MEPITLFKSDPDLWKKALSKFNKTLQSLDEDVAVLQQWLKTQPHLPDLLDSNSLRNFLLMNKLSIEVTKKKIDNYYTLRKKFEEHYGKGHPKMPYFRETNKVLSFVFYPQLTPENYRIIYVKAKNDGLPDWYEHSDGMKKFLLPMHDLRIRKDVVAGDIVVGDFKGFSVSSLRKATPYLIYSCVVMYEKVYSNPVKSIYLINLHPFGAVILSLMKKFMKPKLFERVHQLQDIESIKDVIPLDLLPVDFGGTGHSLEVLEEVLDSSLKEHEDLFDSLDEYEIDESLRPKDFENDDFFGVHGSFKKLNFD